LQAINHTAGLVPLCSFVAVRQVLARPESFDVAVTTYEMVTSAEFGRPIQSTIVSVAPKSSCHIIRMSQQPAYMIVTATPLTASMFLACRCKNCVQQMWQDGFQAEHDASHHCL
jgi:hypothetical protein